VSEPQDSRRNAQDKQSQDLARQQDFLDRLMPFYPKALAYAQTLSGSLMDGEDLVSDAVLSAYSRFEQLRNRDRFREWFFAILLNRFRNLRSRQLLRPLTLVADSAGRHDIWEATARVSGDPAELGYQLTLVKELLSKLPSAERETLLLLGPAGFDIDEVARLQRTTRRAVIQRAYRARLKLAKLLPAGALPFWGRPAAEVRSHD
jgi:RNA polymerase sigma-70 factor, ECF subfamily